MITQYLWKCFFNNNPNHLLPPGDYSIVEDMETPMMDNNNKNIYRALTYIKEAISKISKILKQDSKILIANK